MRILQVIRSLDPAHGGTSEAVKQLGVAMERRHHQVEVASVDRADAPYIHSFPLKVHALGPGTLAYGYSRRLSRWLAANGRQYDAVIINGIWEYPSFSVWQTLGHSGVPYYVFPHGMLDPWAKRAYPLKHIKKCMYWPWGVYPVLRDAAAVLFTAEEERALAKESFPFYSCREVVVNYGTSAPSGDAAIQRRAFFARFPHLTGKRLLLSIGRIHPKKGCDLAIRAFARVLQDSTNWHLVFAGPDQMGLRSELEALSSVLGVAERVTWTGMLTGDCKWGAFHAADALLLPSHQENFGIVVAEALACGLPALISQRVNIWREVVQDQAGFAAPDDLEGTCHLLNNWTAMPEQEKIQMRQRALACFQQRFEIMKAADSILACMPPARN